MAQKFPNYGLSFDWETSGSDWTNVFAVNHQGISLGMVVFDMKTLLPVDTLYIEIKFDADRYQWSAEAEAIHGLSREHLEENGLSNEDAVVKVVEFLLKWYGPNPSIHVIGHNVDFDIAFMKQLLEPHDLMFKVYHRKLDTAAISFIAIGSSRSNDLFEMTGLTERTSHNALEDALMTLEAARRIRLLVQSAIYG